MLQIFRRFKKGYSFITTSAQPVHSNLTCNNHSQCRERQVSEREFTLKQQTDQILGQQGSLQQLQTELMDQYNAVVASLPRLEDR